MPFPSLSLNKSLDLIGLARPPQKRIDAADDAIEKVGVHALSTPIDRVAAIAGRASDVDLAAALRGAVDRVAAERAAHATHLYVVRVVGLTMHKSPGRDHRRARQVAAILRAEVDRRIEAHEVALRALRKARR